LCGSGVSDSSRLERFIERQRRDIWQSLAAAMFFLAFLLAPFSHAVATLMNGQDSTFSISHHKRSADQTPSESVKVEPNGEYRQQLYPSEQEISDE